MRQQKILAVLVIMALLLTACVQSPPGGGAPEAAAGPVTNALGVALPADAAPLDQQVLRYASIEGKHFA